MKKFLSAKSWIAPLLISAALVGCGSSSDGDDSSGLKKFLCSSGLAKGILTVGLNSFKFNEVLGEYRVQGKLAETTTTDDGLKTILNDVLRSSGISSSSLNVSSVSSAFEGDSYRVLKMGGTFSAGFGIVTGLLQKGLQSQSSTQNLFSSIREGFRVSKTQSGQAFDPFQHEGFVQGKWFGPGKEVIRSQETQASELLLKDNISAVTFNQAQWHLKQTRLDDALSILNKSDGEEIRVAVIDTGVDKDHPDLKDVLVEGYNAIDGSSNTDDKNGHGTHCAGIIAGQANSAKSARGVASGAKVKIIPIKVLGDNGSGSSDAIDKGIRWAVEKGRADVISMSLGGGLEFKDVQKAGGLNNPILKEAIDKGVVVIVAAGNESCALGGKCSQPGFLTDTNYKEYTVVPCSQEGTICVGATDPNEALAKYSNFSSQKSANYRTQADVNAPGTMIYSTWPVEQGSYKAISGTSMATPYVAGVVALLKANAPDKAKINQEAARAALKSGLVFEDSAKAKSGTGRVDLYATAYEFSKATLSKTPSTSAPDLKPNPQKGIEPEKGGQEGGGISTVWDLLCAL